MERTIEKFEEYETLVKEHFQTVRELKKRIAEARVINANCNKEENKKDSSLIVICIL